MRVWGLGFHWSWLKLSIGKTTSRDYHSSLHSGIHVSAPMKFQTRQSCALLKHPMPSAPASVIVGFRVGGFWFFGWEGWPCLVQLTASQAASSTTLHLPSLSSPYLTCYTVWAVFRYYLLLFRQFNLLLVWV